MRSKLFNSSRSLFDYFGLPASNHESATTVESAGFFFFCQRRDATTTLVVFDARHGVTVSSVSCLSASSVRHARNGRCCTGDDRLLKNNSDRAAHCIRGNVRRTLARTRATILCYSAAPGLGAPSSLECRRPRPRFGASACGRCSVRIFIVPESDNDGPHVAGKSFAGGAFKGGVPGSPASTRRSLYFEYV